MKKGKSQYIFNTTTERSVRMSNIRHKDTQPELILRKALYAKGIRYRVNVKKLSGKPDIVISRVKLAIFIDGEFWHGYNWTQKKTRIKANRDYWIPKIERNMQRDLENTASLEAQGYTVFRFWEHEIRRELDKCVLKVIAFLSCH